MRSSAIACAAAVMALACAASATTHTVHWDGVSGDHQTIQAGIDAASEGDTVLVAAGTYSGPGNRDLVLGGTNMVVTSESGLPDVIVDCGGLTRGFEFFETGEDASTLIRGFSIQNADGGNGGGISVYRSAPTISHCEFIGCEAPNGGGMYYGYSPNSATPATISNCLFRNNTCLSSGGGLFIGHTECNVEVVDCVFHDNNADSAGGAVSVQYTTGFVTITGCTVVQNTDVNFTGGIMEDGAGADVFLTNNIIAYNSNRPTFGTEFDTSHCVVYGNAMTDSLWGWHSDNLFTDPLFCDPEADDFSLCDDSVCLAGDPENPWGEQVGVYGVGCPSCDSPVEDSTWGTIKSLFR